MKIAIPVIIAALLLTGCATTLPMDPSNMTPEQIKEAVKDKSASMGCVTVQTPYKGNSVLINLDKDVLKVGRISIDAECKVIIENGPALVK